MTLPAPVREPAITPVTKAESIMTRAVPVPFIEYADACGDELLDLAPKQIAVIDECAVHQRALWLAEYLFSPQASPDSRARREWLAWDDLGTKVWKLQAKARGIPESWRGKEYEWYLSVWAVSRKNADRPGRVVRSSVRRLSRMLNVVGLHRLAEAAERRATFPYGSVGARARWLSASGRIRGSDGTCLAW